MENKNGLYPGGYGRYGKTAPDFNRCAEAVRGDDAWYGTQQCARKRGHGPDGAYCKQHDPDAVAARRAESDAKYKAERDAAYAKWKRERHAPAMLTALRQIAEGHNDPRELAAGIVAAFEEDGR